MSTGLCRALGVALVAITSVVATAAGQEAESLAGPGLTRTLDSDSTQAWLAGWHRLFGPVTVDPSPPLPNPPPPETPCSEGAPPDPESCVPGKRWGLAVPGMLGGNVIPMVYNEWVQPWKEISRTAPHTWSKSWKFWKSGPWEWDDNHFFNNQLFHPIQGSFYFTAARSNGFGYYWSFLYAVVGSYLWECCGEPRPGAWNDWINTSMGGAALGEVLHRTTSIILDNKVSGIDRVAREALILPLDAERFMARGVYGHWWDRLNPLGRVPDEWALGISSGLRSSDEGPTHPFFDVQVRYGYLFGPDVRRPFQLFTLNAQINGQAQPIGLVQAQAHLLNRTLAGTTSANAANPWVLKGYVSQNYDYLDSSPGPERPPTPQEWIGYRWGAQSLGLGLAASVPWGPARINAQGEGNFLPIGAVNSWYSKIEGANPAERKREYDFGLGFGYRGKVSGLLPDKLMLSLSYQWSQLNTHNGSTACLETDPDPCERVTKHHVRVAGAALKVRLSMILDWVASCAACTWADHLWVGADGLWFRKVSDYKQFGQVYDHVDQRARQLRFVLSWDRTATLNPNAFSLPW